MLHFDFKEGFSIVHLRIFKKELDLNSVPVLDLVSNPCVASGKCVNFPVSVSLPLKWG